MVDSHSGGNGDGGDSAPGKDDRDLMAARPGATTSVTHPQPAGEERRPPWLLRLKVPAWLAIVAIVVTVLVAFFMTGPARSTARSVDQNFEGAQQVRITYCLTNEQAEDPARVKARAALAERLRELGVRDPEITFVSPCPVGSGQTSVGTPRPPAGDSQLPGPGIG